MQNDLDKLKDIKDIVPVEDYSLYIIIGIVFFSIFLIIVFTYFFTKIKIKPKPTKKELAFKKLKQLDLEKDDTKKIVYTIAIDGEMFVNSTNEALYNDIVDKSSKYKYKKDIDSLDKEIKDMIKKFIKTIKVKKDAIR